MRPEKLRVKNFASYKEETFYFEEAPDIFAIIGENGAGKSTFFVDAITICLFNEGRTSAENFIGQDGDNFEVEFSFVTNGQNMTVIRRKFSGSQELELHIDGVNHSEKIRETQAKINKITGMNYETFLDTILIAQGKSSNFMEKKPNERKDVFSTVLDLDRYDTLEEITKESKRSTDKEIKELKLELSQIEQSKKDKEFYEKQINDCEAENFGLEIDIENKQKQLEKELIDKSQHEQLVKAANHILSKRSDLKSQIENNKNSITKGEAYKQQLETVLLDKATVLSSLNDNKDTVDELQNKQTKLSEEKSSLEAKNEMLTSQAKEVKVKYSRLKDYNEADCQFCGQQITEDHKNIHLTQMSNDGKNLMSQISQNKTKIDEIDIAITSVRSEFSNVRSIIKRMEDSKTAIDKAEATLPGVITKLEDLNATLLNLQSEYDENLKMDVENVESRVFNDATYRIQVKNLSDKLADNKTKIAIAQKELSKIDEEVNKVDEIEQKVAELQRKYAALDALVLAFSKKGIQANIIDGSLSGIEKEINDFLGILSDEKVSIEFRTQKDNKSGNQIETLDVVVNNEFGSRVYETYSGGEKFRVDFACHVGFAKFLAKRAGSPIDFFIVDEGIGSQDSASKRQFLVAVNKLTQVFNKVMVITHIDDIIEEFNHKVEVYKDPVKGSKIRIL